MGEVKQQKVTPSGRSQNFRLWGLGWELWSWKYKTERLFVLGWVWDRHCQGVDFRPAVAEGSPPV